MLKNMVRIVLTNRSAALALAIAILLPLAFNNCSAQMAFEASQEQRLSSLNTSGTIVINNGDEFTNSAAVTLGVAHASADQMYLTNDPKCETGGAWEAISSSKPWTLSNLNSSAAVYVKFSNDGALASDCLSDSIVHDDIAPVVNVATAAPAFTNAANVTAGLAASDSGSGIASASCVGTSPSTDCSPTSLVVKSPIEGSHSFNVTVTDRAGNVSLPRNVSFVVDRTVPTVALNLAPSSITNQVNSTFQFSGNDTLSGVDHFECRAGASATFASLPMQNCASGFTASLAAGAQRFEVRALDRAGNASATLAYAWTIDLGAPTVQITKSPTPYSNQTQATFEFVGTDDGGPVGSYSCKIDSGAAVACSSPFVSSAGLTQGSHTFSVTGTDGAGNMSAPAMYTWIIDTTLPVLSITSKPAPINNVKSADFVLSATDNTGIDLIECQLDGGGYKACTTTVNYPTLTDGNRKFEARAKDRAGNVSAVATYSWVIDTSKPTLTVTSGPAAWVNVRAATIAMTSADVNVATGLPALTIQCKLNDANYAACTSPTSYSGLNEGKYTFTARATDAAGNVSDDAIYTWGVDLTMPAINFGKQPLSLLYKGQTSEIAFNATDSLSGIKTVKCGIDAASADCLADYSNNFLNLPVGSHKFTVVASDKAGNESTKEIKWSISDKYTETIQYVDVKRTTKLDVLVVIDNSGSMANEHKNMAARFDTFIDQLNGLNWQIGIVTTDVDSDKVKKDGRLVEYNNAAVPGGAVTPSGTYIITSAMGLANAKAMFAATIQMTTNGSGSEQGVAASVRAVQRSQQTADSISARNAALFRSDAALAILVVTDADETNPKGTETQNKPETLINLISTTWTGKLFSFHSIIVPVGDSVCKAADGNESYGYNYVSISNLTGGILGTVCATDYGSQLKDIGKSTQELVLSVALMCAPLDTNGDGKPEMAIVTSDGSPAPTYTFEGSRIKFATPLPVGRTKLTYNCVAPN
ncbi:hypothetical protein BH10BDE1_BH10BDE1_29630 [soil metagenome]